MKASLLLATTTLLLASVAAAAPPASPETGSVPEKDQSVSWNFTPDPTLPNVLLLGDSVSIGYTLQVRALLKGRANVFRPVFPDGNRPVNCNGTTVGLRSLDQWLAGHKWSVIHFNWGLHDLKHVKTPGTNENSNDPNDPPQATIEQYSSNLEAITAKLKATGARLIFATTTPVAPGTTNPLREPEAPVRYNAAALKIMKANDVRVDDLFGFCEPHLTEWQLPKNVHFNPTGWAELAKQVATVIGDELETTTSHAAYPPFSWDRVPVYAHVGKTADDFTSEELDFLAKHFNFITIEKGQGSRIHGNTETGFTVAAREIKRRNPRAKVLFYWNASLDSSATHGYKAIETFPADGYLKDNQGNPVLRRNKIPNYDLLRRDVRDWWSDAAAKAVREYGADGIFADEMGQSRDKGLDEGKIAGLLAARVALLEETRRKIGPGKLIVYNGLMRDDPKKLLRYADGAMIEVFGHPTFGGDSKEQLAAFFEATHAAAQAGKIVLLKGWPGFSFIEAGMMAKPHEELARLARERLTFSLACFLVAAEPNCYFSYTWGYRENHGTFDWYPEFDRPLGPPLGAARKTGWSYQREFVHASVSVNLETKAARIDWK